MTLALTSRRQVRPAESSGEYTIIKDNLIECKCFFCNKNYQKKFDEILKKHFFNTYSYSKVYFIVARRVLLI